jgi:hypothetical protein
MKKEVGSGVGSGSGTAFMSQRYGSEECHGSPTLLKTICDPWLFCEVAGTKRDHEHLKKLLVLKVETGIPPLQQWHQSPSDNGAVSNFKKA